MIEMQKDVKRFHREFGILINDKPTIPSEKEIDTSLMLIKEEYHELLEACGYVDEGVLHNYSGPNFKPNIVEVADALGDLIYVILGMAIRFGIDMNSIWNEIQRSNMSKSGGYLNEHGKYIKPEGYSPANLEPILIAQGWVKK